MTNQNYTKKFPYKKVTINWLDANSDTGWMSISQMKKFNIATCTTQGWLFEENNKYIKIFCSYSIDPDDHSIEFGEVVCIPKKWIV